jgi:diguanylate cyclase (GGDEF)-like protein/PAS domain S-box-containing protein
MISPETLVLFLLAATLVIVGIGARLISDARRQRRHRRWAHDVVDTPATAEDYAAEPPPGPKPPVAAPILETPEIEDESVARTTSAVEEQAFEAARQSLTRIAGQTEALLAMPDVRRHERVDMTVRGLAAESGWLLQALNGLMRVREERPPDTELFSVSGLLQSVDEGIRLLAADRRNTCTFENEAGELWLLGDAALIRGCVSHFVAALCMAVKDAHISVRVSRTVGVNGVELRWTVADDGRSPKPGMTAAPFWLQSGQPRSVLSLALAEELGTGLGGRIEVTGVPGQGGTFGLTHPVIVAGDSASAWDAGDALSAGPGEGMRVLAVGGDGETNALLQRCFAYYGHQVSFAANIIEAARAAEPERPDAIVCDLDSPECGNGLLALAMSVGNAAPVPILGVRETVGLDEEAVAGCIAVIAKSEAAEKLVSRVRDTVRRGGRFGDRLPSSPSVSYLLVVDPDDDAVGHLVARLEAASFVVSRADSAKAAMVALETREFDALVVSELLPDMSGLELLRILRSRFTSSQLPVLVAGAPEPQTVVQAIAFGANDFLAKPLELAVTIARISTQLARKRAEQALRDSEERYMLTARGANDGLWDWNCRTGNVHYSPRWKEMLGLHSEMPCTSVIDWLSRVHPEDRPELERQLDQALKDPSADEFVNEHRLLHLDGLHRWVLCRAVVLHDDSGKPVRVAGSHTDITRTKANDALTGLANRVMFNDRIGAFMQRYQGDPSRPFSILLLDLDRFKTINDSAGHSAGDQLLVEVGRRLKRVFSEQFLESRHLVARLGADEFGAILMPAAEAVARGAAEALLAEIERPFDIDGRETAVTASIGVASVHSGYASVMDLVRDAGTAMHRAKANGRGRYEVFDTAMRTAAVAQGRLSQELAIAVKMNEFVLHYQPKIELASGRLAGFEALLRWRHPMRGLLSPGEFIGAAEESGLILPLGLWVIQEACRQLKEWLPTAPGCRVSVNVSAKQFQDPKLAQELREIITAAELSPSSLQLEITESVVAEDSEQAERILGLLKLTGVELELDDFGTGYSSLSRLAKLPIDTVKIDRSFVSQLQRGGSSVEVVRAILSLATSLRLKVVAEGVETEEQLTQLTRLGCPVAQGFLFGGPLTAEEATTYFGKTSPVVMPHARSRRERRRARG